MATGTVKWFNAAKGYGFIVPDAGGSDVFVHVTSVQRSGLRVLEKGQRIAFEVSPRGQGGKEWATALSPRIGAQAGQVVAQESPARALQSPLAAARQLGQTHASARTSGAKTSDSGPENVQIL